MNMGESNSIKISNDGGSLKTGAIIGKGNNANIEIGLQNLMDYNYP